MLFLTNDRAAIKLSSGRQRNDSCLCRIRNFIIRSELKWRLPRIECNLHFLPKRIEAVSLNRVEDADKGLSARQTVVRHENEINRSVVLEVCVFSARWQFL